MADPERTEPATPRHREEVRKRGQIAKSAEVNAVLVLISALVYFNIEGNVFYEQIASLMKKHIGQIANVQIYQDNFANNFQTFMVHFVVLLFPFLLIVLLAAIFANVIQFGFLFSVTPLTPKWENLSAVTGFKRIFSLRTFAELIKSLLKIGIIVGITFVTLKKEIPTILLAGGTDKQAFAYFFASIIFKLCLRLLLALLVIAILDFIYQKWQYEQSIRMTRQEIRDEMKQTEGDPYIKSRIRSIQREMARRRMMEDLPSADVVITNPTHLAVALRYKDDEKKHGGAPVVVAKGTRLVAERIKMDAFKFRIPVIENRVLAKSLFDTTEIGQRIPVDLYKTVAEIIAFIYRLREHGDMHTVKLEGPSLLISPSLLQKEV